MLLLKKMQGKKRVFYSFVCSLLSTLVIKFHAQLNEEVTFVSHQWHPRTKEVKKSGNKWKEKMWKICISLSSTWNWLWLNEVRQTSPLKLDEVRIFNKDVHYHGPEIFIYWLMRTVLVTFLPRSANLKKLKLFKFEDWRQKLKFRLIFYNLVNWKK